MNGVRTVIPPYSLLLPVRLQECMRSAGVSRMNEIEDEPASYDFANHRTIRLSESRHDRVNQRMTMFSSSIQFVGKQGARCAAVAVIAVSALLSGCAGTVTNATQYSSQVPVRPDNIYVYSFASSADQVKLDNSGVIHKVEAALSGTTAQQKQAEQAAEVREQVANELVHQLQKMGLHAVRSDTPAPSDQNVLMVQGSFDTIDAGNRRRRTLIGLGAGKSELSTSVQLVYKPAGGTPQLIQSFEASADSGKMPGIAETAGVGAAAGHIATSAAAGAGLHGASETRKDGAAGDAKKLAESIAKQVQDLGKAQGWMSSDPTRG
ncbi:DUF4410 domain-containing protein [Paraburkholderia sp.]|uniref:DUF4410 domain-containing protein n=1 Tax=Paraburkholderia sp. TaxID=1926495 RepID=UPI0039C8D297